MIQGQNIPLNKLLRRSNLKRLSAIFLDVHLEERNPIRCKETSQLHVPVPALVRLHAVTI